MAPTSHNSGVGSVARACFKVSRLHEKIEVAGRTLGCNVPEVFKDATREHGEVASSTTLLRRPSQCISSEALAGLGKGCHPQGSRGQRGIRFSMTESDESVSRSCKGCTFCRSKDSSLPSDFSCSSTQAAAAIESQPHHNSVPAQA